MTYTVAAFLAVLAVALVDLRVARTRLLTSRIFWTAYAIIVFFQLLSNGVLTGRGVVTYDEAQVLGPRLLFAPVEDLLFGFSLVLLTLVSWDVRGRRAAPVPPPGPAAPDRPSPDA